MNTSFRSWWRSNRTNGSRVTGDSEHRRRRCGSGTGIAEMLESLQTDGFFSFRWGHSIGVPIAVATDYSFIAETATMTIHPIRLTGMVIGVPQTYEYLEKCRTVIKFVTSHSAITEEKFRELMFRTGDLVRDVGSVLVGKDAVSAGLINEIGGIAQCLRKLRVGPAKGSRGTNEVKKCFSIRSPLSGGS